MFSGFKKFLMRGNVVDLAVAVVIGAAFNNVVNALVKDIITPIIGIFGGTPDFSSHVITIGKSHFLIGDFINAIISFLLIAAAIYFVIVAPMNKLSARLQTEKPEDDSNKTCDYCLSVIPKNAKKCKYCTADLVPKRQPSLR